MHTQGKWTVEKRSLIIKSNNPNNLYEDIASVIQCFDGEGSEKEGVANANRIVQTHNLFDDLLKALEVVLEWDSVSNILPAPILHQLELAIAKTEE